MVEGLGRLFQARPLGRPRVGGTDEVTDSPQGNQSALAARERVYSAARAHRQASTFRELVTANSDFVHDLDAYTKAVRAEERVGVEALVKAARRMSDWYLADQDAYAREYAFNFDDRDALALEEVRNAEDVAEALRAFDQPGEPDEEDSDAGERHS